MGSPHRRSVTPWWSRASATSVLRWAAKVSTWATIPAWNRVGCALAGRRHAPHPAGHDGDRLDPRVAGLLAPTCWRFAGTRPRACPHHSGDTVGPGDCAGRRELRVRRPREAVSVLLHQDRAPCRHTGSAEWTMFRTTRGSADRGMHRADHPSRAGSSGGRPCPASSTWRPRRRVEVGSPTWTARAGRWAPRRTPFGGAAGRASSRSACRTTAREDHLRRSSSRPSRGSGGTDARVAPLTSTATTPVAHGAPVRRPGRRGRRVTVRTPEGTARLVRPASCHSGVCRVRRPAEAAEEGERLAGGPSGGVTPTLVPLPT